MRTSMLVFIFMLTTGALAGGMQLDEVTALRLEKAQLELQLLDQEYQTLQLKVQDLQQAFQEKVHDVNKAVVKAAKERKLDPETVELDLPNRTFKLRSAPAPSNK